MSSNTYHNTEGVHSPNLSVPLFFYDNAYLEVAQWLSGRALDWRSLGRGFDPHWGQGCVTTLAKLFTFILQGQDLACH